MRIFKMVSCLLLATVFALGGCNSRVLDFRNAEVVNGKVYEKGANTPFSGRVTNMPDNTITSSQPGLSVIQTQVITVFGNESLRYKNSNAQFGVFMYNPCDVEIREGGVHGDMTCKQPRSGVLRYQMSYKDGLPHGSFTLYDLSAENNKVITATFKNGQIDGKEELFSLKTKKLVSRLEWDKGTLIGTGEEFDENTGNLRTRYSYQNGKIEGGVIVYAPDGKQTIRKMTFAAGLKNGLEEQFDAQTSKLLLSTMWAHGKLNGPFKQWDIAGKLIADEVYENGVAVNKNTASSSVPSGSGLRNCEDRWMAAFRKEQGEETIISAGQIEEWSAWCVAGKTPS